MGNGRKSILCYHEGKDRTVAFGDNRLGRSLAPEILDRLAEAFRARGAGRAILFGSYARGEADEFSDVDLVVIAPSRRPFIERFKDFKEIWDLVDTGVEMLVYTPEEWEGMLDRENGFATTVAREGVEINV